MNDQVSVPNTEAVPAELRERAQWLMWDADAENPRRPHWRGDFSVSYTNPDDWHTFEEAREAASECDSWGIGYVFAYGETDKLQYARGLYGGIDIDGAYNDNGRAAEWVPSMEPFGDRNAWIERSPSEDGLHILLAGFEPPEWWSDVELPDREHTGVEAYSVKFFTVTGDTLEGAGDEVADAGEWVNEWLREAYKAISGTDPLEERDGGDNGEKSRTDREEWLGEDDVRDALEHIDPDASYPLWRDIGFALADHFGDAMALSIYKDWSRSGTKWDIDAERQAERIINDATTGGGRTIGTVIHHAREGGWSMPTASADGGAVAATPADTPTTDGQGDSEYTLDPDGVIAIAGLGEGDSVTDLNDRQKAAHVWDLIKQSDEVHVRVRRDNGSLWAYDGGVWNPDGERELRHTARKALEAMNYGSNVLAELKIQARSDPEAEVEGDEFGLDPGYVAVKNGLLDLDAAAEGAGIDAIRPLEPNDLALTRLPAKYDPTAEYDEWSAYVTEWAEDDKADALWEYVGYCLEVGDMPIHRAVLLVGSGANGKGTFLSVVRALLGEDNTTSIELQTLANERDAVADFYGAIANIDDDLSSRSLGKGLGMFKKLVGGDRVRARRLYADGFEFNATGKHLYAANEVPEVEVPEGDDAFWRRWVLVEFPNHYAKGERDTELAGRLSEPEALSGVLNWAVEGRKRLLEQGYFTNEAEYGQQKRERWQSWGESADKFIGECTKRDPDADRISTGDAHRRYAVWCRQTDEDPIGQQEFTRKLKAENYDYGRHRIDGKTQRGYKALGFTEDVPTLANTPEREEPDTNLANYDQDSGESDQDTDNLAVSSARKPIYRAIEESDDGAPIGDVLEVVPHTPEKAREHIEAMIEADTITRDDDGRLRIV